MSEALQSDLGKVRIAEDVIALTAGMAAAECYGLVGMAPRTVQEGISELLRREDMARGVAVHMGDDEVTVDLHVIVQYGVNIRQVGRNVMEQVKYAVEHTCGLKVAKVNVHVRGVRVPDERRAGPGFVDRTERVEGEERPTW